MYLMRILTGKVIFFFSIFFPGSLLVSHSVIMAYTVEKGREELILNKRKFGEGNQKEE
jgi:hypothetical protein